MVHVAGHDLGAEGDRGDDRRLGAGVEALDVGRRVTLGVAEALGLGQGVAVLGALLGHRVRMKFVVPLTMPRTRRMRSPTRDSRSGRMKGMPPATAASNSRSLPAASAAANSSAPTLASSSLLPVTTGLPGQGGEDQLAGRLDAADHLDHDVDAGVGDDVGGVGGEDAVGQLDAPLLARRCAPRRG